MAADSTRRRSTPLGHLADPREVERAEHRVERLFGMGGVEGRSVLDAGCGEGRHSLAVWRLGAARVVSIDEEPARVARARALRDNCAEGTEHPWSIARGRVTDANFVGSLGEFDRVLAWGSLHASGDLWRAVELLALRVRAGGVIALGLPLDEGDGALSPRRWSTLHRLSRGGPRAASVVSASLGALAVARRDPYATIEALRERPISAVSDAWSAAASALRGAGFEVPTREALTARVEALGFSRLEVVASEGLPWSECGVVFRRAG